MSKDQKPAANNGAQSSDPIINPYLNHVRAADVLVSSTTLGICMSMTATRSRICWHASAHIRHPLQRPLLHPIVGFLTETVILLARVVPQLEKVEWKESGGEGPPKGSVEKRAFGVPRQLKALDFCEP